MGMKRLTHKMGILFTYSRRAIYGGYFNKVQSNVTNLSIRDCWPAFNF